MRLRQQDREVKRFRQNPMVFYEEGGSGAGDQSCAALGALCCLCNANVLEDWICCIHLTCQSVRICQKYGRGIWDNS